jgi:hypothetical protein
MPLVPILVALIIAGLILWAITQFPLDATIVKLIRVVVVVVAVLYVIDLLFGGGAFGGLFAGRHYR